MRTAKVLRAIFLILLAMGATVGAAPAAERRPLPASDAQFASLLQGCWIEFSPNGSFATCFDTGNRVYFEAFDAVHHEARLGGGLYRVSGGKVHFEGDGDIWPFENSRVSCDDVIEPRKALSLVGCKSTGEPVGVILGAPPSNAISDQRWKFSGTLAECDWCDMARAE